MYLLIWRHLVWKKEEFYGEEPNSETRVSGRNSVSPSVETLIVLFGTPPHLKLEYQDDGFVETFVFWSFSGPRPFVRFYCVCPSHIF